MTGSGEGFTGVVFTSWTALGPLIRKFSNSSSEAWGAKGERIKRTRAANTTNKTGKKRVERGREFTMLVSAFGGFLHKRSLLWKFFPVIQIITFSNMNSQNPGSGMPAHTLVRSLKENQQCYDVLTSSGATGSGQGNTNATVGYLSEDLRISACSWAQHSQDIIDLSGAQAAWHHTWSRAACSTSGCWAHNLEWWKEEEGEWRDLKKSIPLDQSAGITEAKFKSFYTRSTLIQKYKENKTTNIWIRDSQLTTGNGMLPPPPQKKANEF